MKKLLVGLFLVIISFPSFALMLRYGMYTTHDPHLFRVQQFDKCIQDRQFPCRWAADSGKGYGEPMFNFYTQFPYWVTQIFHFTGLSLIDSTKAAFIFSLVASGFTMFLFSRRLWGTSGAMVSSVFYMYAPYRAVDVWVRGALPEALAFVFYPLILYFLDTYLENRKLHHLFFLSLTVALLVTTHNLSLIMFLPFLAAYWIYRAISNKNFGGVGALLLAGIFALLLVSYYLLPVIFESKYVTLDTTVQGYYEFKIHYTTLRELFISRYWGYGASLWAQKFLSVSIGQVHWILPLLLLPFALFRLFSKKIDSQTTAFLLYLAFGLTALFLTHGKSSFLWNSIDPMKYIQFPWRFLSIGVLFMSLSAGFVARLVKKPFVIGLVIISCVLANYSFYRPDVWRSMSDVEVFSGPLWDEARSSSLSDFWPVFGSQPPKDFAFSGVQYLVGEGITLDSKKTSNYGYYLVDVSSQKAVINLPVVYFPGWQVIDNGRPLKVTPSEILGLINLTLWEGRHEIEIRFVDTWPRSVGNILSCVALLSTPLWFIRKKRIG